MVGLLTSLNSRGLFDLFIYFYEIMSWFRQNVIHRCHNKSSIFKRSFNCEAAKPSFIENAWMEKKASICLYDTFLRWRIPIMTWLLRHLALHENDTLSKFLGLVYLPPCYLFFCILVSAQWAILNFTQQSKLVFYLSRRSGFAAVFY